MLTSIFNVSLLFLVRCREMLGNILDCHPRPADKEACSDNGWLVSENHKLHVSIVFVLLWKGVHTHGWFHCLELVDWGGWCLHFDSFQLLAPIYTTTHSHHTTLGVCHLRRQQGWYHWGHASLFLHSGAETQWCIHHLIIYKQSIMFFSSLAVFLHP